MRPDQAESTQTIDCVSCLYFANFVHKFIDLFLIAKSIKKTKVE